MFILLVDFHDKIFHIQWLLELFIVSIDSLICESSGTDLENPILELLERNQSSPIIIDKPINFLGIDLMLFHKTTYLLMYSFRT